MVDKQATSDAPDPKPTSASAEDLAGAENYSNYESMRLGNRADGDGAPRGDVVTKQVVDAPPPGQDDPPSGQDEPAAEQADQPGGESEPAEQADPSADVPPEKAETPSAETKKTRRSGKGSRENRSIRRAEMRAEQAKSEAQRQAQENKRLREQLAELQGSSSEDPKDAPTDAASSSTSDSDTPIPEDEYNYSVPLEEDYVKNPDDDEGYKAYLADVDRYSNLLPLQGGKYAKGKPTGQQDKAPTQTDEPPADPAAGGDQQQVISGMFEDVKEILDGDEADASLADNFIEGFTRERFPLSYSMVEFLSGVEDEEQTRLIAKAFIDQPRLARIIARKPESQHVEELTKLAKRLAQGGGTQPAPNGGGRIPVVQHLKGRGSADASADASLVNAGGYQEYEVARRAIKR